jgi:hypothetical protein
VQRPRPVFAAGEASEEAAPTGHALQLLECAHDILESMHTTGAELWQSSTSLCPHLRSIMQVLILSEPSRRTSSGPAGAPSAVYVCVHCRWTARHPVWCGPCSGGTVIGSRRDAGVCTGKLGNYATSWRFEKACPAALSVVGCHKDVEPRQSCVPQAFQLEAQQAVDGWLASACADLQAAEADRLRELAACLQ